MRPLNEYALVRPIKKEENGLVQSETIDTPTDIGEVIIANHTLEPGQRIFYDKFLGRAFKHEGEEVVFIRFQDIIAIL